MEKKFNSKKFFEIVSQSNKPHLIPQNSVDRSNPTYRIGMFVKLINNGVVFSKDIISFFSKSAEVFDVDEIKRVSEYMMFYRAYFWVGNFDKDNEEWLEALKEYPQKHIESALSSSIKFFEKKEEYEKCAFLVKILDSLKNS